MPRFHLHHRQLKAPVSVATLQMTRARHLHAFIPSMTMETSLQRSRATRSALPPSSNYKMQVTASRRAFLSVVASIPLSVAARRCDASTVTEALLELKAAEGALDKLETLADFAEYDELRQMLRSAPLNRIRSACSTLYRSLPDEMRRKQAENAYKKLIRSVEETDVKALRVSRGEIKEDVSQLVHQVRQLFDNFSVLVEE